MPPKQTMIGAVHDASNVPNAKRRKALAKLGLAIGAAYIAPTIVHLDRAVALQCPSGYHQQGSQCVRNSSDVRLKRDIAPVARLENGIVLYRYRYHWSDQLYVGVMAQEVAAIVPEAVSRGPGGFLRVDYAKLGLRLLTWEEWQAATEVRIAA